MIEPNATDVRTTWRQRRAQNRALRQAGLFAPAWLDMLGEFFGYTVVPAGAVETFLGAFKYRALKAEALAEHERGLRAAAETKATEALRLAGELLTERTMAETEIDVLAHERDAALTAFDNDGDH
jgi:hypothetical protein